MTSKNLGLLILLIGLVHSVTIQSSLGNERMLIESPVNKNLLRLDSSVFVNSCARFNGTLCTMCKDGFILTNGKCYEIIPNCLIQYSNICATCQPNYRPVTSSSNTQQSPAPSYTIICIPKTAIPTINSTTSTNNSSTSLISPLITLGRQTFINWKIVQVRYPTDVYLVMIWNYLDGSDELTNKVKIQDNILTSCVQGKLKDGTDRLSVIKWVIDNQLTNFVQGYLIDLSNLYFYRLRYKSRLAQTEYEVLVMIHQINFKITLLQQLQVTNNTNNGSFSTPSVGSNMTESDELKNLRQQVLDLMLKVSQQRELNNERQSQMLLFQQYTILSAQSIQSDPNCMVIKSYLQESFTDFIKMLEIDPNSPSIGLYSWMNFNIKRVYYRKSDSIDKQFLYEISFTTDITVLAQFILNRTYQINSIKIIFNR